MERKPWHEHAPRCLSAFLADLKVAKQVDKTFSQRDAWMWTWSGMCDMMDGTELPHNHDEIRRLITEIESELEAINDGSLLHFIDREKKLAAAKAKEKVDAQTSST